MENQKKTIELELLQSVCEDASKNFIAKIKKAKKQDPELKDHFFQVAFLAVWKSYQKNKIDFNNQYVRSFLYRKAIGAIQDEIRDYIVPFPRSLQSEFKYWDCPICNHFTNYKDHKKNSGEKNCKCGTEIIWEFNPFDNPLYKQYRESEINEQDSFFSSTFNKDTESKDRFENLDEIKGLFKEKQKFYDILCLHYLKDMPYYKIGEKYNRSQAWAAGECKKAISYGQKKQEINNNNFVEMLN